MNTSPKRLKREVGGECEHAGGGQKRHKGTRWVASKKKGVAAGGKIMRHGRMWKISANRWTLALEV